MAVGDEDASGGVDMMVLHFTHALVFALAIYESFATVGEIRVYRRADFQSGSRVLKKVF